MSSMSMCYYFSPSWHYVILRESESVLFYKLCLRELLVLATYLLDLFLKAEVLLIQYEVP